MGNTEQTYGLVTYDVHEVPVRPGETIRIGRSADNDLVLPLTNASRFHVEVRWVEGADHPDLVDLGSQNGTRLDGEPLQGVRELHGNETIEIAGGELRFRMVFPGSEALLSDSVGPMDLFSSGQEELSGALDSARELGPIVDRIEREQWTGTLHVDSAGTKGRIMFCMGHVMSARQGEAKSARALELIVRTPGACDYRFTGEVEPSETGMAMRLSDYLPRWTGMAQLRAAKPKPREGGGHTFKAGR